MHDIEGAVHSERLLTLCLLKDSTVFKLMKSYSDNIVFTRKRQVSVCDSLAHI